MSSQTDDATHVDQAEVEQLRARVASLEAQLAEQTRKTSAMIAEAQEKLYWLERWHVDLDSLMARPAARAALGVLKAIRRPLRLVRKTSRRLTSGRR